MLSGISLSVRNTLVLSGIWLIVLAGGIYYAWFYQHDLLTELEQQERVYRAEQAEVGQLLALESSAQIKANNVMMRWDARYKYIPDQISSPEIVRYLNGLTQQGFKNFDVVLLGTETSPDYKMMSFSVTGRSYYTNLYQFIWHIENNSEFYKVREVNLNREDVDIRSAPGEIGRRRVMVAFSFTLDAYFGGIKGASVEKGTQDLPMALLPARQPIINPFYPYVFENIAPNLDGLLDVENAELISIAGDIAIFKDKDGYRRLKTGDAVYLGRITKIDPANAKVFIRLNRGGIIDQIEMNLATGERSRQAMGPAQYIPIQN